MRLIVLVLLLASASANAANYSLQVVRPDAAIGTADRIYKAYPGITYTIRAAVFGGMYPFTYELSNAPSGMTINSDTGAITWLNPQSSATDIVVTVTDAEDNTDSGTWSIAVGTSGFIFVDASAASGGDGTLNSPFNEWDDFYLGLGDSTYNDYVVYFHDGTYTFNSAYANGTTGSSNRIDIVDHPKAYLAYPGENAVYFDGETANHLFVREDNTYFDGINFINGYGYHVHNEGGDYMTVINCTFNGTAGTGSFSNQSQILYRGDAPGSDAPTGTDTGYKLYGVIQDNDFSNSTVDEPGIKTYGTRHLIIEDNTFHDLAGDGIDLKSTTDRTMVRHNTFYDIGGESGLILRSQYYTSNTDISFNLFNDEALIVGGYNSFPPDDGPEHTYIYRNTIVGLLRIDEADTVDGPFSIDDNIIVNPYSDSGSPGDADYYDQHIHYQDSEDITAITTVSDNVTGVASDSIVDSSGLLQGAYRTTYLGVAGFEIEQTYTNTNCTGGTASASGGTVNVTIQ